MRSTGLTNFLFFFVGIYFLLERAGGKSCLEDPVPVTKTPTAGIAYSHWDSSAINAQVAAILLREYGGFNVTVRLDPTGDYDYLGMAEGITDVNLEVWAYATVPTPIWFENRSLTLAGSLGVVGRSGWFMPQYALDALPNLASFRGFEDCDNVVLLDSNATQGNLGELVSASPEWTDTKASLQVIENGNLCLEAVFYSNATGIVDAWIKKVEAREPILFYYWEPTEIFLKHKYVNTSNADDYLLDRVSLPYYSIECDDLWNNGYNCDYEQSIVVKMMSNRRDLDPELIHFYQSFTMSNADQRFLLAEYTYTEGFTYYDAACSWVKENREKWTKWFWDCPNDCFGQGVCENSTCTCFEGFEGDLCQTKIENRYMFCSNGTQFLDFTGLIVPPDLTDDPLFIKYDLVCDQILDCDNWEDEKGCSPSVPAAIIAFSVLISLSCLAVIASLVVLIWKRDRGRIRVAGLDFLVQFHLSVLWGMTSVFLLLGKPSDAKCGMLPWWIVVPSGCVIASLVSKQYRAWRVLVYEGFFPSINSLRQRLIAITVILVLIDCVILIIWSAIDLPKEGLRKVDGEYHALCVADHFLPFFIILVLYKFLIIFVSAVLAWKSRNLPSAFSEARHIGFALYNAVFLMIIFIPIILALNDQPFFSWILAMLGLWLWFFTIFLLVIGFVHVGLFQDRHKPLKEKNLLPVSSSSRVSGSTTIEDN